LLEFKVVPLTELLGGGDLIIKRHINGN